MATEDDQETFQRAAERFAEDLRVPAADPIVVKRSELHHALGLKIAQAAQAKADLIRGGSTMPGFTGHVSFRNAEREVLNAVSTLIEWEATLL